MEVSPAVRRPEGGSQKGVPFNITAKRYASISPNHTLAWRNAHVCPHHGDHVPHGIALYCRKHSCRNAMATAINQRKQAPVPWWWAGGDQYLGDGQSEADRLAKSPRTNLAHVNDKTASRWACPDPARG
jgi:hypothetical protein